MKFHILSSLALSLSTFQDGIQGFQFPNPVDIAVKALREETKLTILDGVGLPTDTENLPVGKRLTNLVQGSIQTNIEIVMLGTAKGVKSIIETLPDQEDEKKDLSKHLSIEPKRSLFFRRTFAAAINDVIKVKPNDPDPAEGYKYFGNRDFKKILPMLCQVNPFFASALTVSDDKEHFELIAFTDEPELVEEPLYLSLMREMTDDSHRINAKFDKQMNLVEITKLDESGDVVVVPESEWDYYSSGILYNMLYYSSTVHANIHILHYLMCACIIMSTRGTSPSMEKWADIFDDNIAIKYVEVAALLFESEFMGGDVLLPNEKKIISGKDGFGATAKVMPKVKDMLKVWGACKNECDFTKNFLLKSIYMTSDSEEQAEQLMRDGQILTEFNKHRDNVQPFADDLTKAMKEHDSEAFDETETTIKSFMEDCGTDVSSIDSVSSWSQLMCMTGLVHGSTLSYTRLILAPEVARWRNIHSDKWDDDDTALMGLGFATAQGMTLDRHVFTHAIEHGWVWKTENILEPVMEVLKKYDDKAEELKIAYAKEIEERDDFCDYGWILTDHCVDGYDGKQHTITTYI